MHLDPQSAAQYALIALTLVLLGAILTPGDHVTIEQRAVLLAGMVTVLGAIAYRRHRTREGD